VREALETLPWVEPASIQTDVSKQEVRFNLRKDKGAFDRAALANALKGKNFPEVEVIAGPR
jgi:hypothetical protein